MQTQVNEGVEDIGFLWILKKEHVEIPGVFMKNFDLGISTNKGCHTILPNLQG